MGTAMIAAPASPFAYVSKNAAEEPICRLGLPRSGREKHPRGRLNGGCSCTAPAGCGHRRSQHAGNLLQLGAGAADGSRDSAKTLAVIVSGARPSGLRLALAAELIEGMAGAGQRISLAVDQALDLKGQLYIAAAVKALAGSALVGFQLRKLRLPEAQDIRLDTADASDIADLEIKTIRDYGRLEDALPS